LSQNVAGSRSVTFQLNAVKQPYGERASFRASVKQLLTFPLKKVREKLWRKDNTLLDTIKVEWQDEEDQEASRDETNMNETHLAPVLESVSVSVENVQKGAEEKEAYASQVVTATAVKDTRISGDRWAVAAQGTDLSGHWNIKPFVTADFKKEYDHYLKMLGQPSIVRSVAVSIVSMTTEETIQTKQGQELMIRGKNVRGIWERTLLASGAERSKSDFEATRTPMITCDSEHVEAEAWWEQGGTVHRSWLYGIQRYGGGSFESLRYLENNGQVLVCESIFHPNDKNRDKASITWRFQREGTK
jgi:hypothetical protein